jgi:putative resolvase
MCLLGCWDEAVGVGTTQRGARPDRVPVVPVRDSGTLPVPARKLATGTILVDVPRDADGAGGVARYARVSAHDQRSDLDRQLGRLAAWAAGQGLVVTQTVAEVGSGLNSSRPKLRRLLADPAVTTIVVEHYDRLAWFGVEQLLAALPAHGRQVLIAAPTRCAHDPDQAQRAPRPPPA